MTDTPPGASSPQSSPPSTEVVVDGIGAAPGIAIGTVHLYRASTPEVDRTHVSPNEVDAEIDRLDEAIQQADGELETGRSLAQNRLDSDSRVLFDAQALMLRDEEVVGAIRRRIREEHESAARALRSVLHRHRRRLADSGDARLRRQASDLEELESRLLRVLQREEDEAPVGPNAIVVADRLTAADIIRFGQHGLLGCVTARGGRTSHVSIIARALDVPAVVGAEGALDVATSPDRALLDGRRGRFIVRPDADTLDRYRPRRAQRPAPPTDPARLQPTKTADGRRVVLRATAGSTETLGAIEHAGAEGIGLLRTEMLFFGKQEEPTEEDQFDVYRRVAEQTGGHGATIRLLDLGGDKPLPPSPQETAAPQEDNPFLGWRGVRVLLDRPETLLRPQIRALLRANAHGTLRVLVPMVAHLDEVRRVRSLFEQEANRLADEGRKHDAQLPIGAMVEVPSVALQAKAFAKVADFMSIGTNDLTQYVLATDRGNDRVAGRFDALHPAVLRLVKRIVEAGQAADTPVSLCGEVAGDACALPILVGLGLDVLSVPPPRLPELARVLSDIAYEDAEALAKEACAAPHAEAVRRMVREWEDRPLDTEHCQNDGPALDTTEGAQEE